MVYTTFENGENNGSGIFLGYLWNSKHTTYKNGDNTGYLWDIYGIANIPPIRMVIIMDITMVYT